MPIDMSFVHSPEFKASEAGKTYWDERMEKEKQERERQIRLERENLHLKMQIELTKPKIAIHYVLVEPWAVYVKEGEFFKDQGGLEEEWGMRWVPVMAGSIEEAREMGIKMRGKQ
jgi:hypothetical protein